MDALRRATRPEPEGEDVFIATLFQGYRFTVCEAAGATARALDIRRRVYVDGSGYAMPIPDQYDARSWFLLAEDLSSGEAVGSMRLTPRYAGPLEAEEYFTLPASLDSPMAVEINRFAILPAYRKGKTFLPVVSLGLFKLVMSFLQRVGAHYMVIASKPERIWTYEWMRFKRTGLVAEYEKLHRAQHELLSYDFRRAAQILAGHPFYGFFVELQYPEVIVPTAVPALGIGVAACPEEVELRQSA